jgi:cell division septation protein DedD
LPQAPDGNAIVLAYSFSPNGAKFDLALTITFTYDPTDLPSGIAENDLYIAYFDGTQWQKLETIADPLTKTVTAKVSHFSNFALMGEVSLPQATNNLTPTPVPAATPNPTPAPTKTPAPTPTPTLTPMATPTANPTTTITPPTTTPATVQAPVKGTNWWLIAGIIVGVIIVLLIVAFLWLKRKYKSNINLQ